MSIKTAAYAAAKAIWSSELVPPFRELIKDLNASEARGTYGYNARGQHAQALGYLLVDQHRDRLPFPVPEVSADERRLLGTLHRDIVALQRRCGSTLTARLPAAAAALDVYADYEYTQPQPLDAHFITPTEIDSVAREFANHAGITRALETVPPSRVMSERTYIAAANNFLAHIRAAGVHSAPADFAELAFRRALSVEKLIARHIAGVVSVRESLRQLSQLMFQAALTAKLPVLSADNVIAVQKHNSHVVGDGVSVVYQLDRHLFAVEPGSVVLLSDVLFMKASWS